MKRGLIWTALVLFVVGIAGAAYLLLGGGGQANRFRTATVDRGAVAASVSATGQLAAVTTVLVGSQVSGQVKELFADFNSRVERGQLIARIDPDIFQAKMAARSQERAGEAALRSAQAQLAASESQARAATAAVASVEAALEVARAQLVAAEASVRQKQAALDQARLDLQHTEIRAPVNGVVVSRNVDVGQTVAASLQAPTLFSIAQDLTRMQVEAAVDEADVGRLRQGMPASFAVDAFPGRTFRGEIVQIRQAPQVIQNVVTYTTVVTVPNPERILMPGMTANVRIQVQRKDDVLRIPNAALRYEPKGERDAGPAALVGPERRGAAQAVRGAPAGATTGTPARVFVRDRDGTPRAVSIVIGLTDGAFSEVLEGDVEPGQEVIVGEITTPRPPGGGPHLRM